MLEHLKMHEKIINCSNCGYKGHSYKYCKEPIQSLGVIVFRIKTRLKKVYSWETIRELDKPDVINDKEKEYNNIEFLMIRRRDTLGFVEFVRGRYSLSDLEFIKNIFEEMTIEEKNKILVDNFEKLWCDMWLLDRVEKKGPYKKEFYISQKKFMKLKAGYYFDGEYIKLDNIIRNLKNNWLEPEWGFPKGRRNPKEKDTDCANRELCEETGIEMSDYILYKNIKPFEEVFLGSNNVLYKHIYYLGQYTSDKEVVIDETNRHQKIEISKIQWMNYNLLKTKIRSYNEKRLRIVKNVLNTIKYKGLDK